MEDSEKCTLNQGDGMESMIPEEKNLPAAKPARAILSVKKPIEVDFGVKKEEERRQAVDANDGTAKRPPKIKPAVVRVPRIGELYWCDLPKDAHLPELWKRRSVVVISRNVTMNGTVVVLPTTSDSDKMSEHMRKISVSLDHRTSYAICDKPMTLAVSRFCRADPKRIPKLPTDEVDDLIRALYQVVPAPPKVDTDKDGE
jgi:mRNA interferase MazF